MMLALFAIMGRQFIDSTFVAQLGSEPLVALVFPLPIYQFIVGIQVGIGMAASACILIVVGEKSLGYAKHLATIVLGIGCFTVTLVVLILSLYQTQIFHILGAEPKVLSLLAKYWLP